MCNPYAPVSICYIFQLWMRLYIHSHILYLNLLVQINRGTQFTVMTWEDIEKYMFDRFEKEADLKAILFVIGLRESGNIKTKYTKENKQDLMNLAACKVLSLGGYFEVAHLDAESWPVWKQSKPVPEMNAQQQEQFLKDHIIKYFEEEKLLESSRSRS